MGTLGRLLLLFALCISFAEARRNSHRHRHRYQDQRFDSSSSASTEEDQEDGDASGERILGRAFGYRVLSVCWDSEKGKMYTTEGEACKGKIATGRYRNAVNETGWGILEVETFKEFEPEIQAYAAGVAEGVLTKLQIYYHYRNTIEDLCKGYKAYCDRLYRYLNRNLAWIKSRVSEEDNTNIYWRQVNLTFTQLTGIWHGYSRQSYSPTVGFDANSVFMLQLSGELFDLDKFLKKKASIFDDPEPGRCSGLVKITEGNTDLLMSHVAMSGYNTMNRVLKMYKFAFDPQDVPGHTYSFSGYPGALASADDYTLVSSGLLSIETTISVFNETLYTSKFIKPEGQLHCWVRSTIANQLARTAEEWTEIFAKHNSGTYNNQWTVVDYKLFQPGKELPNKGVIWVLEQVPGFTESKDVTWFLRKYRYWPSYNIPYLKKISHMSGFDKKSDENNWWRWGFSPRAKIFHRDQHKVKDIESLRALMRYNNYQHDEFSRCSCNPPYTAEAGIAARGDLNPANGTYEISGMGHRNHGSLDYKGTNYELFKKLQIQAQGGPTYDPLPPFNWVTTDLHGPGTNHYGQPSLWKFKPFVTEWQNEVVVDI